MHRFGRCVFRMSFIQTRKHVGGPRAIRKRLFVASLLGLTASCTETQLNHNTLTLASTVSDIQRNQILGNVSAFIDDPDAMPAQVEISGGTLTVTDQISPSFKFPWAPHKSPREFDIGGSDQWSEGWSIAPVTDSEDIKRLRALYRYAIYGNAKPQPLAGTRSTSFDLVKDYPVPPLKDPNGNPATTTNSDDGKDYWEPQKTPTANLVNTDNVPSGFLYWTNGGSLVGRAAAPNPPPANAVDLGTFGNHDLWTDSTENLGKFIIFVLAAPSNTTGSSGAGGKKGLGPLIPPPSIPGG